jgi:mannosyltransferase OCH1-like enzyme
VAIPKTIYQTFKSTQLSIVTRWHINRMRRRNPEYDYRFYDDAGIEKFIGDEYGSDVFKLYKRINIGAAKADFFRYAVLYKRGGVYLDIDSQMLAKLDAFVAADDRAIISLESNLSYYVQWALIYEPGHPFLAKTLEIVIANLSSNQFPHDVHWMTGPGAYTSAIKECLKEQPTLPHREVGVDYDKAFKFRYPMSKFFVHGFSGKGHWQKQKLSMPVIT